ncbi:uncharacterized protein LOC126983355 isoform X5 [Eriocheir sinensis]|uniref:uncharacterized protein LOC126983355 isoform X5 n=1 Tax=Eriocheir sinensis TaxID=95602 RepID=UPI0021C74C19|nr:uncharacterized protein LOC126983355 isoform X5 [Eriocheir sinensis]
MECSRCRSRHAAHGHTRETRPEPLRARGRGRDRAQVVREGVSKWTFPSRPSFRPLLVAPTSASSVRWSPGNSWDLQIQHSIPDMEDVVSDELRQRIERVLTFPIGRSEGEELANDSCSTNGPAAHTRAATGGLLQDYLDQLHPELGEGEAEEDEDEDEDELLFQGPEGGEESEADLLYDPEKEQYITTYLLFLQQLRVGRRSAKHEPEPCPDDLLAPRTQAATSC